MVGGGGDETSSRAAMIRWLTASLLSCSPRPRHRLQSLSLQPHPFRFGGSRGLRLLHDKTAKMSATAQRVNEDANNDAHQKHHYTQETHSRQIASPSRCLVFVDLSHPINLSLKTNLFRTPISKILAAFVRARGGATQQRRHTRALHRRRCTSCIAIRPSQTFTPHPSPIPTYQPTCCALAAAAA